MGLREEIQPLSSLTKAQNGRQGAIHVCLIFEKTQRHRRTDPLPKVTQRVQAGKLGRRIAPEHLCPHQRFQATQPYSFSLPKFRKAFMYYIVLNFSKWGVIE